MPSLLLAPLNLGAEGGHAKEKRFGQSPAATAGPASASRGGCTTRWVTMRWCSRRIVSLPPPKAQEDNREHGETDRLEKIVKIRALGCSARNVDHVPAEPDEDEHDQCNNPMQGDRDAVIAAFSSARSLELGMYSTDRRGRNWVSLIVGSRSLLGGRVLAGGCSLAGCAGSEPSEGTSVADDQPADLASAACLACS